MSDEETPHQGFRGIIRVAGILWILSGIEFLVVSVIAAFFELDFFLIGGTVVFGMATSIAGIQTVRGRMEKIRRAGHVSLALALLVLASTTITAVVFIPNSAVFRHYPQRTIMGEIPFFTLGIALFTAGFLALRGARVDSEAIKISGESPIPNVPVPLAVKRPLGTRVAAALWILAATISLTWQAYGRGGEYWKSIEFGGYYSFHLEVGDFMFLAFPLVFLFMAFKIQGGKIRDVRLTNLFSLLIAVVTAILAYFLVDRHSQRTSTNYLLAVNTILLGFAALISWATRTRHEIWVSSLHSQLDLYVTEDEQGVSTT